MGAKKEDKVPSIIKKKKFANCIHVMNSNVNPDLPTDFEQLCLREESLEVKNALSEVFKVPPKVL